MTTALTSDRRQRAARVRLLLLDVDGVLTDGGLYYFGGGEFAVRFDVKDGLGLVLAHRAGLLTGIVSSRPHPEAERRARELGLAEVHVGVVEKLPVVTAILERHGLSFDQCAFVGDDIVDLPVLAAVGFPVAVADAVDEVRRAALVVTQRPGGRGAVREIVELLLAARR